MPYRQTGFTLIELSITVAIAALIMTVAIPSYQSLSGENHASAHQDDINSALRLSRHLAVEHNRLAKLCARAATSDPTAVPTCSSSSGDWGNGWVVMLQDGSGTYQDVMSNHHTQDKTIWTVIKDNPPTAIKEVVFGPTGTLRTPSAPAATLTLTINDCSKITQVALSGQLSYNAFGCE